MGSDHSDSTTRRTKRGRKSGTPPGENLAPKRTRYDVGAALASLPGAENAPAQSGVYSRAMFCNNRGQKSSPLVLDSDDDEAMYEVGERARMEAAPMQTSGLQAAPMESGATNGQAGALGSAVEGEAMFVEDGSHAVYRREDTAIDRDEYDHRGYYDPTVVSPNAYDEETNVESEVKAEEVDDELFNTIQDPFAPTGELKYFSGGTEEDKQKMALDMPGTILEKTENGGIRKRPIINRNAPAQRKRKLLEPDMERKLVKECKWLFFLHMNHEVVGAKEEIVARCAPHLNMKDLPLDYEDLFREIIRKVNTYRQPLIQKAIKHAKDMMIQDKKEGGQLWLCHDHQTLCDFFWGRYTHAHFLSVWTFIAPFIDLPNSSPLATYYCQSVYANVCARAKLHNDWLTNTASEDRPNSRMQHSTGGINAYLKEFPTAPQFENISRGEFKEMDSLRIGKNRTKVEAYVVTPKDRHFVQAPPPPSVTYERSAFGSAPVGTPGAAAGTPVADAGSAGGRFNSPAVTVDTPFTEEMIERGRRRQRGLARGGGGGGRGRRGGEGAGMTPN